MMNNKIYFPYIALVLAGLLLFFIRKNQRGTVTKNTPVTITVPYNNDDFNRKPGKITYSRHARCRMDCRHIDESEVLEILQKGEINRQRIEEDKRGKTYPLEGITRDKQHVRIVFAPREEEMVVVTVIDLGKDWACDCN